MIKSLQDNKTARAKARFFGRLILRLMLAAVIGVIAGKLFLSTVHPEPQATGGGVPRQQEPSPQSPGRLKMASKSKISVADKDGVESALPSSESLLAFPLSD